MALDSQLAMAPTSRVIRTFGVGEIHVPTALTEHGAIRCRPVAWSYSLLTGLSPEVKPEYVIHYVGKTVPITGHIWEVAQIRCRTLALADWACRSRFRVTDNDDHTCAFYRVKARAEGKDHTSLVIRKVALFSQDTGQGYGFHSQ